jgi:hypothetical protein
MDIKNQLKDTPIDQVARELGEAKEFTRSRVKGSLPVLFYFKMESMHTMCTPEKNKVSG